MDVVTNFDVMYCKGIVRESINNDMTIIGKFSEKVKNNVIRYIAASPADHRGSFTGSGLPFANQIQAFDGTPNVGEVVLNADMTFQIDLITPNSYMVGLGSMLVPPTLYIRYASIEGESRLITIKLSNGIPYRLLTYPTNPVARKDATFYDAQFFLPVRSQEDILYDSGYPLTNLAAETFWGLKPPL